MAHIMPLTNHKTAKFDIDFDFGVFSEQQLIDMFENNGKVEVKTERDMWKQPGTIAIEFKYKGKPSGISTTEADWWIHCLNDNGKNVRMITFPTNELKKLCKRLHRQGVAEIKNIGDDNNSKCFLIPINKLL